MFFAFVWFIAIEFRKHNTHLKRVENTSCSVGSTDICEYSSFWIDVLFQMLVIFYILRRPSVAGSTLLAMKHNIGKIDCGYCSAKYRDDFTN